MRPSYLIPVLFLLHCAAPSDGAAPSIANASDEATAGLPAAPAVSLDVTAAETTALLPNTSPWKINTYDLVEPYAVPATPNGKLLVFMPGSLAQGDAYTDIVGEAAAIGYYAVALSYPNGAEDVLSLNTLSNLCGNNVHAVPGTSFDCYHQLRANRFDGTPEPNGIAPGGTCTAREGCVVDPYMVSQTSVTGPSGTQEVAAEGIQNRLYQLANYLGNCDGSLTGKVNRTFDAHWCAFIDTSAKLPLYNQSLVLAGHSQGGGEAAYIAKIRSISGIVMFSSPEDAAVSSPHIDGSLVTASADWLSDSAGFVTPLSSFYALTHEQDEFLPRIEAAWDNLASPSGSGTNHLTDFPASCADATTGTALPKSLIYAVGKSDPAPCYATTPTSPLPPFGGAHRLYTNTSQVSGLYKYHDSTVVDAQTPACPTGSHPLLTPAWRQMLYGAGHFSLVAPSTCDG